jgi:2-methylisocitrate lyase-like PEP mutase family enzyme
VPQLINLVVGGKTPIMSLNELNAAGFSLVLYANVALQGALLGMQTALQQLQNDGVMQEDGPVASFALRQASVNKPFYDALETKYAHKE